MSKTPIANSPPDFIRPNEGRVVIIPQKAASESEGGIIIPDIAKEQPAIGRVIAVGPAKTLESGEKRPMPCSRGDTVIYEKYGGCEMDVRGTKVRFMRDDQIMAVILPDDNAAARDEVKRQYDAAKKKNSN